MRFIRTHIRRIVLLAAVTLALVGAGAYVHHFGRCESVSRFCVLDIAGTRSEIGVAWVGRPDLYISTWPSG